MNIFCSQHLFSEIKIDISTIQKTFQLDRYPRNELVLNSEPCGLCACIIDTGHLGTGMWTLLLKVENYFEIRLLLGWTISFRWRKFSRLEPHRPYMADVHTVEEASTTITISPRITQGQDTDHPGRQLSLSDVADQLIHSHRSSCLSWETAKSVVHGKTSQGKESKTIIEENSENTEWIWHSI